MNRQEYEELKKQQAELSRLLREGNLTDEARQQLLNLSAALSGKLLSPWIPFGWGRRSIMLFLFLVGVYGLIVGHPYLLLAWVGASFFSPHAMGLLAYLLGRLNAGLEN